MAKKDEEKVEGEAAVIAEASDGPLLDLNDAGRQANDQARQKARLRHL